MKVKGDTRINTLNGIDGFAMIRSLSGLQHDSPGGQQEAPLCRDRFGQATVFTHDAPPRGGHADADEDGECSPHAP